MNQFEIRLQKIAPSLYSKFEETKSEVNLLLGKYSSNFPSYTDHSINHTLEVFQIASEILTNDEIENLNSDEIYILSMACILHDIGMCIPEEKINQITESDDLISYKESHPNLTKEEFIRDIHHQLSRKFILQEWELLSIPSIKYAKAIGIVAEGHRKVDLGNFDVFEPQYFAKSGKEFVSLPYLAAILRIADELDVTNSRTPRILTKYYMPNNEISVREWAKHIATSQRNYLTNRVIFEVACSDQNIYAALQEQFEKIQNVINYCQKIIRAIPFLEKKYYALNLGLVEVKYEYISFDPKGIKFTFDVQNVVNAFVGEDLYKDKYTSLREALQNSIDSCRYKSKVLKDEYVPYIKVFIEAGQLIVEDNGAGMDEFIIENFFGKLASSFYEQEKIKTQFEAIGQFGVGVFSYFLLSEFIDIETKTKNSNSLKFRFDKDPKSYFHFYDRAERNSSGTTITMHLKKEVMGEITFRNTEKYIRNIFKHVEIPIEINGEDYQSIIQPQSFVLDPIKEIRDRIKLQNKKLFLNLSLIEATINDDEIEGTCALIVSKNYLDLFSNNSSIFDSEMFNTYNRHITMSQISTSQKGVFVNFYGSSYLELLVGNINIKKKIRINIDRNEFSNIIQIYNIIQKFEFAILNKIFNVIEFQYKNNEERLTVTNSFLSNYANYINEKVIFSKDYINLLHNSLYVRVFDNSEMKIINIKQLCDTHEDFILISDKENIGEIKKHFNYPIIIATGDIYNGNFNQMKEIITILAEYHSSIIYYKNIGYEFISKNNPIPDYKNEIKKIKEILGLHYWGITRANSKKLIVSSWLGKSEFDETYLHETLLINYNHSFIKFILTNYDIIKKDVRFKRIIKSVFDYIFELKVSNGINKDTLNKLNEIIDQLNEISKIRKLVLSDF